MTWLSHFLSFPFSLLPLSLLTSHQLHYNPNYSCPCPSPRCPFPCPLQLTYTPKLRPNDMGTLTTGVVGFVVPARSRWSPGPNICPPACTRRFGKVTSLGGKSGCRT